MNLQRKISPFEAGVLDSDAHQPHNETVFDLADFIRIVRIRKRVIIGTAILVVALVSVAMLQMTPLYSATTSVMLDQRQNKVEDLNAVLSGLPTDPASVENQVQILTSRNLLGRVADKLHLDQDPEFNTPEKSPLGNLLSSIGAKLPASVKAIPARWNAAVSPWIKGMIPAAWYSAPVPAAMSDEQKAVASKNAIIDRLRATLSVSAQGRSTAIEIRCESPFPAKAAQICNTVGDSYVEDQLNAKFDATQEATKWLADRIQQLADEVKTTEAAVQTYKAENNLDDTGNGSSVVQQQLGQVNEQLVTARSDLAEQEARFARVAEMQKSGRAADILQVVASPLIGQLRSQQAELVRQQAELSTRYGPRHPKMLDIASQMKDLNAKIDEEVQRVAQTSASDVAVARARVKSLQDELNHLTASSQVQNKARVKLAELTAAATSSRSLYEAFLARFNQTEGQQDIQAPDARIISRAEEPKKASFPNHTLFLGIATPIGLMLGLMLAMTIERLDAGFRTVSQIERLIGLPVLTVTPELRKFAGSPADRIIEKPLSAFSESIRGLQLGLTLSNVDKHPKVIVVTSSVPNEGKTTIALSLARLSARSGRKTVVVDGDLRRPNIIDVARRKKQVTKTIVDVLSGEAKLSECLLKDENSDLMMLPALRKTRNPADLLGSLAMERLVAQLREEFDVVIIDSAPLLPVNDTKVLARLTDAIVFVVQWEKTPREGVVQAARVLSDLAAPVAGIVLGRADDKRYRYYNYGYRNYYDYNKYYTS